MSVILKGVFVGIVAFVLAAIFGYGGYIFRKPELPTLEDKWWGLGPPVKEEPIITRTKIDIREDVIRDLHYRLLNTGPFQPSLEGTNQRYGAHTTMLNNILEYWKSKYNWTERQQYLNQYPHYFVNIRGLKIHFLHIKPKTTVKKNGDKVVVLPLMMVHGWPGSFREFYEIIPKLIEPREDAEFVFELIIPSLPGFTFSQASVRPGLSAVYMAQILADLMDILGFNRFFIQGGDWGSNIVQHMAVFYPGRVIGVHSNMCCVNSLISNFKYLVGRYFPSLIYEPDEAVLCNSTANSISYLMEETGYFHIQSTKPDTVGTGYATLDGMIFELVMRWFQNLVTSINKNVPTFLSVALRDSPMGLAAYIIEKFSTLTNPGNRDREDGGLTEKFTMEQLLDNIMLYWVTGCMTGAMRIYAELFTNAALELKRLPIQIPSGCARFPYEILLAPRSILEEKHKKLVHLTSFQSGGHFAALEEPEMLANDVYKFVKTVIGIV